MLLYFYYITSRPESCFISMTAQSIHVSALKTRDSGESSARARAALIAGIAFIIPMSIALLMGA